MGLIRFYLAISVVYGHNATYAFGVPGHFAVLVFFVISGFFMGLVLNEKYLSDNLTFYIARYLRLWPSYIVVFLVVILFLKPISGMDDAAPLTVAYMYFVSATMFFYETLWWFSLDQSTGGIAWVDNVNTRGDGTPLAWHTPMAHMWSIGIELSFYLVAPFVMRNVRRLAIAFVLSYLMHLLISFGTAKSSPLHYKSAMNFVWLFFMGGLAYHFLAYIRPWLTTIRINSALMLVSGLLWTLAILYMARKGFSATRDGVLADIYFVAFAITLGPIFHFTATLRPDRALGELSYPIYLSHWPLTHILIRDHRGDWLWSTYIAAITVIIAFILYRVIERPVDRFRASLFARTQPRRSGSVPLATP